MLVTPAPHERVPSLHHAHGVMLRSSHPELRRALPSARWQALEEVVASLPMERQLCGDIADHRLEVGMVLSNRPLPRLACPEGRAVLDVLEQPGVQALFRTIAGHDRPLHLRRVQVNRMGRGTHNHAHRDRDDDPDYTIACAMYFTESECYRGGALVFPELGARVEPSRHDVVFFRADLLHALTPVTACTTPRLSLIVLMGEHDGPNRRFEATRSTDGR